MQNTGELNEAKLVVVGGGAVGVCIAYRLAQAGANVSLVERNYPGGGTSNHSFAWLNAFGKFPRSYSRFNLDGIRDHRDLVDELNGSWLHMSGALHWANESGQSQFGSISETVRRMRGWGVRIEEHTADVVTREIEPALRLPATIAGPIYLVRGEGWIQPAIMIQEVLHSARHEFGVRLIHDDVAGFTGGTGEIDGVKLKSGEIVDADVVVIAAGPDSNHLARLAGSALRIERSEGVLVATAPAPALLRHVLIGPDVVLRPDGGGRILMSSEELLATHHDSRFAIDRPEVHDLLVRAQALLPGLAGVGVEVARLGVRPIPTDGYPIIGFDAEVHGLYWAVMHSGITLAARTGRLVTEDLCSAADPALDPFRPDRFAEGVLTAGPSGE